MARELVNRIQNIRKEGLDVTDRISVILQSGEWDNAVGRHRDYICSETLCVSLTLVPANDAALANAQTIEIVDGKPTKIVVRKAEQ